MNTMTFLACAVAGASLAVLALVRWLGARPPRCVRDALASSAGLMLRRAVLEAFFPEVARVAHLGGIPLEAVGALLVELGQALMRGGAQGLLEELQRDRAAERAGALHPLAAVPAATRREKVEHG